MKKIHYLNLGMGKSGTTAIFDTLMTHPDIDFTGHKENYLFSHHGHTLKQYTDYYKNFNVSLNFCPSLWTMETEQIKELDTITTHYSMIFRNPYHFIESLYSFVQHDNSNIDDFIDMMLETNQLDYAKILHHWDLIIQTKPFKILYYEDLTKEPNIYQSLIEFLGLNNIKLIPKISNVSKNKMPIEKFSIRHIKVINKLIEKFEQKMSKDLSHWKMHVEN
jgi:hypothetical protein